MVCFPNSFSVISWPSLTLGLILLVTVGLLFWQQQNRSLLVMPMNSIERPVTVINQGQGDSRYSRAPEPERDWNTGPDLSRIPRPEAPFNIPTQGIPESYQSMGIVKTSDGKLLPLFGRRSISARERYNYYTRTDTYNPIPLPIEMQGRDCQDQVGCPELFNGDRVKVSTTNDTGEVTIYKVRDIIR
jgi:hypothetical protein